MSILMFIQTLSGAVFLTFADVIFSTGLKSLIPKYAPGVSAQAVIAAGATGIRDVVSIQDLPGVLKAYAKSVDHVFYLVAAMGVWGLIFSLEWVGKTFGRKRHPLSKSEGLGWQFFSTLCLVEILNRYWTFIIEGQSRIIEGAQV